MRVTYPRHTTRPFVLLLAMLSVLAALSTATPATASAGVAVKTIGYRGISLSVPRDWPVYRLSARSHVCVRFNRHAVYLGQPGAAQSCPEASIGRTEAILIQPSRDADAGLSGSDVGRLLDRREGVSVTATWRSDPAAIRTALHLRTLRGLIAAATRPARSATRPTRSATLQARTAQRPHAVSPASPATPGSVFDGEGFDACATPSEATMSAWGASSPYTAIGIYIGGINMGCSQPNLTSSWVQTESADGWHLAPIYVGEQAPSETCGCAAITASQASAEGSAAAVDAVYDAQSVGIGAGNPIYFDMEGYSRNSANSTPVLAFLEAWTEQLHTDGYLSGVYSSDASGIADLAEAFGTSYVEPDDIWVAAWNGQASTADSTIPTTDWPGNERIHQYAGGNRETYGGITIDVDNDFLDSATAAFGGGAAAAPVETVPSVSAAPTVQGVPVVGQVLTELHASWSGSPTTYAYQWYRCTKTGTGCAPISGATGQTYELATADAKNTVVVAETAANSAGTSVGSASAATVPVAPTATGFWSFTSTGAVDNSEYQRTWGSPSTYGLKDFVGMAATRGRLGYWMVTRYATVYAFGNAMPQPSIRVAHPVVGILRAPTGGYWLYTAAGNVYASAGTSFYGSPARHHPTNISGMASLPNGPGYWLVARSGTVYAYGHAPVHRRIRPTHPIIGIIAAPHHGYWLYTAHGNVYPSAGAGYYGSPANHRVSNITGMLATPDGRGYWLITHTGTVYAYGDAATYPDPTLTSGAIVGLAG